MRPGYQKTAGTMGVPAANQDKLPVPAANQNTSSMK